MYIATPLPEDEIKFFKELGPLEVIFDVGARTDFDYYEYHPNAEFHLFEPNPEFFTQLKETVGDKPNVFVNNIGLGDAPKEMGYNDGTQSFVDSEAEPISGDKTFQITTLDIYCAARNIQKIDFLKIDTEGYDYKVLQGAGHTLPKITHLQYEYWNNKQQFHDILENEFYMHYTGSRNVLCTRKSRKVWKFQGA